MNKTIYTYHPQTGEFLGEDDADPSPLEPGVWLLPAFSTATKPPQVSAQQVAVFGNGQWQIKTDRRGHSYWLADGTQHTIANIGDEPPAGALAAAPPPPLAQLKAAALAQVRAQRTQAFNTLAGLQAEALALDKSAKAQAIAELQQKLRDLPATDLSHCKTQADIEATFKAAWASLATSTRPKLSKVFSDLVP